MCNPKLVIPKQLPTYHPRYSYWKQHPYIEWLNHGAKFFETKRDAKSIAGKISYTLLIIGWLFVFKKNLLTSMFIYFMMTSSQLQLKANMSFSS
jgi:hypothetical protein